MGRHRQMARHDLPTAEYQREGVQARWASLGATKTSAASSERDDLVRIHQESLILLRRLQFPGLGDRGIRPFPT
jgi:hypothetical protein